MAGARTKPAFERRERLRPAPAPAARTRFPVEAPVTLPPAPVKRTLAIMHVADICGPSRSLEDGLRWLAADGGQVSVLMPGEGRLRRDLSGFARIESAAYSPLMVPSTPRDWLGLGGALRREVRELRAAIRSLQPELVIVSSALLVSGLAAARREGVPTILYAGEVLDEPRVPSRWRSLAGRALISFAARSSSAVVACSDRVARQYQRTPCERVATIHPPIGHRYATGDGLRFRIRHGISPDVPLVISVGALTHGRGQDVLIRALPAMRRRHPALELAIVGEPHPRDADRAYARELFQLADDLAPGAVTFAGFEGRIEDAYAAADVVVNPTRYEAFGRVAFEAMVAGRPVVSTSAGAVAELLRDGSDALLVPPDDPRAIAGAVCSLLQDPDRVRELVAAGAPRALVIVAPERALPAFCEVVEEVVGR